MSLIEIAVLFIAGIMLSRAFESVIKSDSGEKNHG